MASICAWGIAWDIGAKGRKYFSNTKAKILKSGKAGL